MKAQGNLLIELMIVLALVAFISYLGFSQFNFSKNLTVKSEVEKLYAVFNYLAKLSQVQNRDIKLKIDAIENSYFWDNKKEFLSDQVKFGFFAFAKGPPSNPSNSIKKPISFENDEIIFYSDGKISAGTIYLIDKDINYMYAISCPVSEFSYIRRYAYQNKWILLD